MKQLYRLILSTALLLALINVQALAQEQSVVTGTVVDVNKQPMIGATIVVLGTNIGVSTDINGKFSIKVDPKQALTASYLGYEDQNKVVGANTVINFVLKESESLSIDEVVVVGYGEVKKSDLTGSVASIKSEVFENVGGASFTEALAGKVAGMQVVSNSGVPGAGVSIKIRGSNSMGSSEPLYIIDGVMFDTDDEVDGFATEGSAVSPLSMISSSDIASMEILKDASATAIYGSRASNGVVIITTKMGQAGKTRVNASLSYGISELYQRIDVLDTNQYWIIRNEALVNAGGTGINSDVLASALKGELASYDWQDTIFKMGQELNASASFSGGTDKIKYSFAMTGYMAEGIIPKTDIERLTGRLNLDFNVTDKFKIGTRTNIATTKTNGLPTSTSALGGSTSTNSVISRALRTASYVNPDDAGNQYYDPETGLAGIEDYSPIMAVNAITQENTSLKTTVNIFGDYEIIKGLKLKVSGSYSNTESVSNYYQNTSTPYGLSVGGWARVKSNSSTSLTNENTLTYVKKFNRNHSLNAVAGASVQTSTRTALTNSVTGFPSDDFLWYNLSAGSDSSDPVTSITESTMVSWFGRANYTYKSRYLFTLTARVDGSSKFADNNKYGFFPAGAFAWRVSEEGFMADVEEVSNLKLRVSYGVTGNSSLSSYSSLYTLSNQEVVFGSTDSEDGYMGTIIPTKMPNSALKWETTNQLSAGIDLGLFRNKVEIVMDYYHKRTKDLLVTADLSGASGYDTSLLNFGEMTNQGFEFNISSRLFSKNDFSWNASFNISFNKTIVTKLEEDYYQSGEGLPWNSQYTQILIEGQELGIFYGYKRDGIRQEDEGDVGYTLFNSEIGVGDQKYEDVNGDGIINSSDEQIIGYAQPIFTAGFSTTFKYKNFDLTFYLDSSYGNDICNMNLMQGLQFGSGHQFAEVMYRWTPENPSNEYPKVSDNNSASTFVFSDRYIEDGSYLRLQNITLGYNFPREILTKLRLGSLRVYASVSNIVTITGYSGYTPDVSYGGNNNLKMGHDSGNYPTPTTYRVGVNVGF